MKEHTYTKLYDVFISHSSKDGKLAVALCHFLEARNLRCWMAPRDINAGKDYAEAIIEAIQASKIMVVVFSASTNDSRAVRNEVERAFNHQLFIIPFRTKDIIPAQSFEFFLSSTHWLDAIDGNAEDYFEELYKNCAILLNKEPLELGEKHTGAQKRNGIATKKIYFTLSSAFIIAAIILFFVFKQTGKNVVNNNKYKSEKKVTHDSIAGEENTTQKKNQKQVTILPARSAIGNAIVRVPSVDLSFFNGASYSQLSTNYNLTFNESSKNRIQFSGTLCGYQVNGTLIYLSNMNFKVSSGNVKGNISFLDSNKKAVGNIVIKESDLSCNVDLIKD